MNNGFLWSRRAAMVAGSALAAAPAASARPAVRRVGVLMGGTATDPGSKSEAGAIRTGLEERGWTEGVNLRIDYRWHGSDPGLAHTQAGELIALAPDAILAGGSIAAVELQKRTRVIPIVFVAVGNPVEQGLVASIARPGGNVTGFTTGDDDVGAERLKLLKRAAPRITRVLQIFDPHNRGVPALLQSTEAEAARSGIAVVRVSTADVDGIATAIETFARQPGGGVLVLPGAGGEVLRGRLVELVRQHGLPSMFGDRPLFNAGGLISYGVDGVDQIKQATGYIDLILKGATPAEMPVLDPAEYEVTLNLGTARHLGLDIPPALLARADRLFD